jgi:hypothetical protein
VQSLARAGRRGTFTVKVQPELVMKKRMTPAEKAEAAEIKRLGNKLGWAAFFALFMVGKMKL